MIQNDTVWLILQYNPNKVNIPDSAFLVSFNVVNMLPICKLS